MGGVSHNGGREIPRLAHLVNGVNDNSRIFPPQCHGNSSTSLITNEPVYQVAIDRIEALGSEEEPQ